MRILTDEQLLLLQSQMLEKIATTTSIEESLGELCLEIQELVPRSVCTIMQLEPENQRLSMLSLPHVSDSMCAVFDGLDLGERQASCGTAAFTGQPAIVKDTQTDPRWSAFRKIAQEFGIGACWSIPIFCDGKVVGTFAISSPEPRRPTEYQMRVLETARHLAGIAISRHRADDERRSIELKIQQTQRLESLGILAGGIAHDFNNLLTGAIGNLDLAGSTLDNDSDAHVFLGKLESALLRMSELSRQMLAYSGGDSFELEPLYLEELVTEMSELLHASVSKNATMRLAVSEARPRILGDAARLRQVMMNLITNASDALDAREGIIELRFGQASLNRESVRGLVLGEDLPEARYAWFEVEDNGVGMSAETREKIFDPFFTTKHSGHGLGLAATLGIVRSHHGAIEIDSELGRGTRIRVWIPECLDDVGIGDSGSADEHEPRGAGVVLIVEDEEAVRSVASEALQRAGFDVLEAQDGEEGVRLFHARGDDIDAVLLDFTLPGLDGAQVMRSFHAERPVPIILSSGHSRATATKDLAELELAGFLQKPYRAHELTSLFARVVEPRRDRAKLD